MEVSVKLEDVKTDSQRQGNSDSDLKINLIRVCFSLSPITSGSAVGPADWRLAPGWMGICSRGWVLCVEILSKIWWGFNEAGKLSLFDWKHFKNTFFFLYKFLKAPSVSLDSDSQHKEFLPHHRSDSRSNLHCWSVRCHQTDPKWSRDDWSHHRWVQTCDQEKTLKQA